MTLFESFVQLVKGEALFKPSDHLLVAVSGGVDSVVLCELLHRGGFPFQIAHCNFRLRGEESQGDEEFVRMLGKKLGCEVHVAQFDTKAVAHDRGISVQQAARDLRYAWFERLMQATPSAGQWLLTAHHADDNAETIVMHFFRGTGVAGLRGIPLRQGNRIRPLLSFHKQEILSYAKECGLQWREDSSNTTEAYTRNYFRHRVLPLVEEVYPGAVTHVLDNARRMGEVEEIYRQAIGQYRKKLLLAKGAEFHIPVERLRHCTPLRTIFFELVKPFGFRAAQLPDLLHLLDAETGKYVSSGQYRILRNRKWLIIVPAAPLEVSHHVIDRLPSVIRTKRWELQLQMVDSFLTNGPGKEEGITIDAGCIVWPLLLRKWKQGDYFYPLGMKKKKKVARFLIDEKVPMNEKEDTWVLVSDERILCVLLSRSGVPMHRIDERCKRVAGTAQLLRIGQKPLD